MATDERAAVPDMSWIRLGDVPFTMQYVKTKLAELGLHVVTDADLKDEYARGRREALAELGLEETS